MKRVLVLFFKHTVPVVSRVFSCLNMGTLTLGGLGWIKQKHKIKSLELWKDTVSKLYVTVLATYIVHVNAEMYRKCVLFNLHFVLSVSQRGYERRKGKMMEEISSHIQDLHETFLRLTLETQLEPRECSGSDGV